MPARVDHRQVARFVAVSRMAVGTALTIAPGLFGRAWIGDGAKAPAAKLLLRAFGVRDLALGAGAFHALATGGEVRTWVVWGGISDAVDAGATLLAIRQLPLKRSLPVLAVAMESAAIAAATANHVD
jgi:hypothetical protein